MTSVGEARATTARRVYDGTMVVLVGGGCLLGVATAILGPAVAHARRATSAAELAAVVGLALAGVVLVVAGRLGPVWVTAPERSWLSPGHLLRRRSRAVLAASVGTAVLAGLVVAAAVPAGLVDRAACGLGAAGVVGLAALAAGVGQRLDRSGTVRTLGALLGLAAVLVALVATGAGRLPLAVVVVTGAVALVVRRGAPSGERVPGAPRSRPALVRRPLWRSAPPLWELRRAGATVDALWMATVMLDGTPLATVADAQLAPRRRRLAVRPVGLPLVRTMTASRVADLLPLVAVPAAVVAVGGTSAGVVAVLVLTYAFSLAAGRLLDVWFDSPALARTFVTSRPPLGSVLVATGVALTGAYALLACGLAGLGPAWAGSATAVAVLAWSRRLSGRRTGPRVGALLATPAGPVPVDLALRVVAGLDVLVLSVVVLPLLVPGAALVAAAGAAVAYLVAVTRRGR